MIPREFASRHPPVLHLLTSPLKQLSLVLRNRENQRRSRARRKDYIRDLEKRLRQFERESVRVTAEVQLAAREVAEHNQILRALLVEHGVSVAEIERRLKLGDQHIIGPGKHSSSTSYHLRRPQPMQNTVQNGADFPLALNGNATSAYPIECYDQGAPQSDPLVAWDPMANSGHVSSSPDNEVQYASGTWSPTSRLVRPELDSQSSRAEDGLPSDQGYSKESQASSTLRSTSGTSSDLIVSGSRFSDSTSCEEAARIIAGMRGHDDADAIWPELGCNSSKDCVVRNMTIFQIVDR